MLDIPEPQIKLVHVHPGAEELGRVYRPHLAINAAPTAFCAALAGFAAAEARSRGAARVDTAHADYLAWGEKATPVPGAVNLGEIMVWLRENLPAGRDRHPGRRQFFRLGSSLLSRAQIRRARRRNVRLDGLWLTRGAGDADAASRSYCRLRAGDGDFLMTGQDFATAVQYDLPVIVLVADNGIYGTIRMHQERDYPGRVIATDLRNPDFVAYALAFGGYGAVVEKSADFPAAFAAARCIRKTLDHPSQDRPGSDHADGDPDGIREKSLAGRKELRPAVRRIALASIS